MTNNKRLFLAINKLQGRSKLADGIADFIAQYLIFVMLAIAFFFVGNTWNLFGNMWLLLIMFGSVVGVGASYVTGLISNHPRPVTTFTSVKQLFTPLGTWKSFPSDHTILSLSLFWPLYVLGGPIELQIFFGVAGILIGFARVYGGVHYPGDVVGGMLYSGAACYLGLFLIRYFNLFTL